MVRQSGYCDSFRGIRCFDGVFSEGATPPVLTEQEAGVSQPCDTSVEYMTSLVDADPIDNKSLLFAVPYSTVYYNTVKYSTVQQYGTRWPLTRLPTSQPVRVDVDMNSFQSPQNPSVDIQKTDQQNTGTVKT